VTLKCGLEVTQWKVVPFESLGTVSYSPSMVTMAVSLAISEIFSVKEWPYLEIWVWSCSRSLKIARFNRLCMTFYFVSSARYSNLLVENRKIFITHLYLAFQQVVTLSEFREDV